MKLMSLYIPLNTNQYSDNSQANEMPYVLFLVDAKSQK